MSMSKEQWESLQGNAGWAALRQFLRDYRERLKEHWASGSLRDPEIARGAAIRAEILGDLADMDWDTIDNFYRPPTEPQ